MMQSPCKERMELEQAVRAAVQAALAAKLADRFAALTVENDAIRALKDHTSRHGCEILKRSEIANPQPYLR